MFGRLVQKGADHLSADAVSYQGCRCVRGCAVRVARAAEAASGGFKGGNQHGWGGVENDRRQIDTDHDVDRNDDNPDRGWWWCWWRWG
ncbi:AGAP012915-PA [Anopheles gambiae str. PEST]|uniref:AGAP012915-PA n=1 Tax=Anopheles gambiae TaxID=7165 RepID=Q5TYJ6_ANOGA|nr:AGAP012915-PA [Anopheles gambiae str. PEST]